MGFYPKDMGSALVRLAQANADLENLAKENTILQKLVDAQSRMIAVMAKPKPVLRIHQRRGRIFDSRPRLR